MARAGAAARPQLEFTSQLARRLRRGRAYHAQMCGRMAHPELQSEATLHLAPAGRPEAFGIYLSLGLLPLEPQSEFTSQLTLGGCAAAGLTMHKMRAWCRTAAHDPNQD
jgi:hypothetical protein